MSLPFSPLADRLLGRRGLLNLGSTCYLNVVLQTLIHNPLLRNYFLSDRHNHKLCDKKDCMCCEMDKLFAEVSLIFEASNRKRLRNLCLADLFQQYCTSWSNFLSPRRLAGQQRPRGIRSARCPRILHLSPQPNPYQLKGVHQCFL